MNRTVGDLRDFTVGLRRTSLVWARMIALLAIIGLVLGLVITLVPGVALVAMIAWAALVAGFGSWYLARLLPRPSGLVTQHALTAVVWILAMAALTALALAHIGPSWRWILVVVVVVAGLASAGWRLRSTGTPTTS